MTKEMFRTMPTPKAKLNGVSAGAVGGPVMVVVVRAVVVRMRVGHRYQG